MSDTAPVLKVGLSGAGPIAASLVRDVRTHAECDVIAVHDDELASAQALARTGNLTLATERFDALLGSGVDFVVLTGPHQDRVAQVTAAAEQQVPCLVAAPFATTLADARSMVAAAAANEVRLGVLVPAHGDPVLEQLRRMLAADWLGGVTCVQAIAGDDELLRTGRVDVQGDVFLTLAAPHLHVLSWLIGRQAVAATAQTTRSFVPDMDDGGAATVVWRGNVVGTFLVSRSTRASAFALHGTDGGLRIAGDRVWLSGRAPFRGHVFDYETPGLELVLSRTELREALTAEGPRTELCGRFARWLEDCDDFPCPGEQALLDLEIAHAMAQAANTGGTIRIG